MISRRLTNTQKAEILEAYKAGDNTNSLAETYSCTPSTINRTVKKLLSNSEYLLLKEERSNISLKKLKTVNNENVKERKEDLGHSSDLGLSKEKVNNKDLNIELNNELDTSINQTDYLLHEDFEDIKEDLSSENQIHNNQEDHENNFELIEPLLSSFDFDQDKQTSAFEINNFDNLPESVYMIVDKKVELEFQLISELPEWSFLPENELERNAILLFSNQRSAKRSCSRNQRVIKIPNTDVFNVSKSYLIAKGITRLILEDSIIALDN